MNAIKFNLSGKTAFFKKHIVNEYVYFTFNNIHKIALSGVLGAVMGLGGYQERARLQSHDNLPEFYLKLKDLNVSIVPNQETPGVFRIKQQYFNNSVGYANKDGNLQVRELWLENPNWDIYLLDDKLIDNRLWSDLKYNLFHKQCVYMPYLGKNDHPASISDVDYISLEETDSKIVDSIFPLKNIKFLPKSVGSGKSFYSTDEIPVKLNAHTHKYECETFAHTNKAIMSSEGLNLYKHNDRILCFF
jgi:CRISPR-associated protein Cas5h